MEHTDSFSRFLRQIQAAHPNSLRAQVAKDALAEDDPAVYLDQILTHGCESGLATQLIYYRDVYPFYDRFHEDIQDILDAHPLSLKQREAMNADARTAYCWWAYWCTALHLCDSFRLRQFADSLPPQAS